MFASRFTLAPIAAGVAAAAVSAATVAAAAVSAACLAGGWGAAIAPVSSEGEWKAGVDRVTTSWASTMRGTHIMRLDVALKPGWHTYWQNPGDSGSAPKFNWKLPEGWTATAVQYPRPEAKLMDGLPFFGYETSATYIVEVVPTAEPIAGDAARAPTDAAAGTARVAPDSWSVNATILVCKDICVRGSFSFEGMWPPATGTEPVSLATETFNGRGLPRAAEASQVTARLNGQTLVIEGPAQGETTVRFVPESAPGLGLAEEHEDVGFATGTVAAGAFRVEVPLVRTPMDASGRLPDAAGIVLLGASASAPHYAVRVPSTPSESPVRPNDAPAPKNPAKQPSGS